jgi:anti-sigma regulatory factor (Ser/Thr protein kinase)
LAADDGFRLARESFVNAPSPHQSTRQASCQHGAQQHNHAASKRSRPDFHRQHLAAPRLRWATQWEGAPPARAVPSTRHRVNVVLAEWDVTGEAVEPTLLVVTELLSNAIEHGRGPVWLSIQLRDESVYVEVRDDAPEPPQLQPPEPLRVRGRGLQVTEAVSSQWGWTADPPGKIVWADVPTNWPD